MVFLQLFQIKPKLPLVKLAIIRIRIRLTIIRILIGTTIRFRKRVIFILLIINFLLLLLLLKFPFLFLSLDFISLFMLLRKLGLYNSKHHIHDEKIPQKNKQYEIYYSIIRKHTPNFILNKSPPLQCSHLKHL